MNIPDDGSAPKSQWSSFPETLAMRVLVVLAVVIAIWLAMGQETDIAPCKNFWGSAITGTNEYRNAVFICNNGHPQRPEGGTMV